MAKTVNIEVTGRSGATIVSKGHDANTAAQTVKSLSGQKDIASARIVR